MATSSLPVDTGQIEVVENGDVTTPAGYRASGVRCGLKHRSLDLALIVSDRPATVAGVFTRNKVQAPPVSYSRRVVEAGTARAIVCNSANANACTGEAGMRDAQEMAALTADELGLLSAQVVVASTGVIGVPLKMQALRSGIPRAVAALEDSGAAAAEAILTTDKFAKRIAVRIELDDGIVTVGAIAKGAGMIQPDMATTLCFLTTDAAVESAVLQQCLRSAIADSFNCVTVDGDTSTNDCAVLLANGASEVTLEAGSAELKLFERALALVCLEMAKMVVRDGEGATKLVEIRVEGATDDAAARQAAFTIANSPLVKTAVYGRQANWGRVIAAAGRAGVDMREDRCDIWFNSHQVVSGGLAVAQALGAATKELELSELLIRIALGVGSGAATVWTSDLTEEYVRINGSYIS